MRWLWLLAFTALPAAAHEAASGWSYDPVCCGGEDCRMLQDYEVRELPNGWQTPAGLIDYSDKRIRPSQDGRFHICIRDNSHNRPYPPFMLCFYVPPRGM
jgi:hypothetical protein